MFQCRSFKVLVVMEKSIELNSNNRNNFALKSQNSKVNNEVFFKYFFPTLSHN